MHLNDFWAYDIDADAQAGRQSRLGGLVRSRAEASLGSASLFPVASLLGLLGRHRYRSLCSSRDSYHQSRRAHFPRAEWWRPGGTWNFTDSVAEIPETFNMLCDYPGGPTVALISSMATQHPDGSRHPRTQSDSSI
ncbi:MAG: hypothetical protein WKF84_08560 [Pyrinomonadaceae bacterium]